MGCLLTEELPKQVAGVPIAWDARTMIRIEQLLFEDQLPAADKVLRILTLFYPSGVGSMALETAWAWFLWFQGCGQTEATGKRSASTRGTQERAYDFAQDGPLIAAAFQQAYQIDLFTENLHWWRFRALFDGLPNSCRLSRIMEYRTIDTAELAPKSKAFYDRMKARYALTPIRSKAMTVEEHEQEFINRLRREG